MSAGNFLAAPGHKLFMQVHGRRRLTLAAVIIFSGALMAAQQKPVPRLSSAAPHSAQGNLSVECTVTASVGIVIGPDKAPRLVLANATDAADNVSRIQYVALKTVSKGAAAKKKK
jgi:hypothetical protein